MCAATVDQATGTTGLLIVSGGNEIRVGSHRGMVKLAAEVAQAGFPVFRYDRRGTGDSEGYNGGFETSGPDMRAALAAFRAEQPQLDTVVALGNCDGATALLLHRPEGLDGLIVTNPWIVEAAVDEPAPAAARAYYAERIRNPRAWLNLLSGRVNLRKTAGSLSFAVGHDSDCALALRLAHVMVARPIPTIIILAEQDGTAIAFAHQWADDMFAPVRDHVRIIRIESASHSFAAAHDHAQFSAHVIAFLQRAVVAAKP